MDLEGHAHLERDPAHSPPHLCTGDVSPGAVDEEGGGAAQGGKDGSQGAAGAGSSVDSTSPGDELRSTVPDYGERTDGFPPLPRDKSSSRNYLYVLFELQYNLSVFPPLSPVALADSHVVVDGVYGLSVSLCHSPIERIAKIIKISRFLAARRRRSVSRFSDKRSESCWVRSRTRSGLDITSG